MNEKSKEIMIKSYISGKSFDDLIFLAQDLKIEGKSSELLKSIDNEYRMDRMKIAKRDLIIAISAWLGAFLLLSLFFIGIRFALQIHVLILLCVLWIPFFKSYWVVVKNKKRFEA